MLMFMDVCWSASKNQPGSYTEQNPQRKWKIHSQTGRNFLYLTLTLYKNSSAFYHL